MDRLPRAIHLASTTVARAGEDKRGWYLTLRPGMARLRKLRTRVADELIPALEAEGTCLAGEDLEARTPEQLAEAIEERLASVRQWTKTYWEEFLRQSTVQTAIRRSDLGRRTLGASAYLSSACR